VNAALVAIALKSIALLAAACLVSLLIRRASAAVQHLVWTAAFAGLLALPLLNASLPSLHIRSADRMLAPGATFRADAIAGARQLAPVRSTPSTPAKTSRAWPDALAILWLAGASVGCARLLLACAAVARARANSEPADSRELASLARELGIGARVRLYHSGIASAPMTAGLFRPAIFLPLAAPEWSAEKRRSVLLHELAHIRRGDIATQIFARFAVHLYWWNPLAWYGWRQFLTTRERAADDAVLAAGSSPAEYASHLLEIARSARPAPAFAAIGMAQPSQLESRLAAILDSAISRKPPGRFLLVAIFTAGAGLIAPLAAIEAQDPTPPSDVETTIRLASSQNNFEMLDRAADAFVKNRQYDPARKLLEASLEVRGKIAGTHSDAYSEGLLKLGDLEWDHYKGRNASDDYARAIALGEGPQTAQALLRTGIFHFHELPTAENYIQRAILTGKGDVYAESLAWMAEVRAAQGDSADAESLFLRAQSAVSKNSAAAALIEEMYAAALAKQDREGEARAMLTAASDYRQKHVESLSPGAANIEAKSLQNSGVHPPTVIQKVNPEYSQEARALKIAGTVVLGVIVGADGTAAEVTLKRSLGFGLDEQACAAISQWKFNPATQDGAPVPVKATIEVNFRLM